MAQVRIQDGLARLVEHFIQGDDEGVAQTLEVCKRLIERYGLMNETDDRVDDDESVADVEHVSELIKRRCIFVVTNIC